MFAIIKNRLVVVFDDFILYCLFLLSSALERGTAFNGQSDGLGEGGGLQFSVQKTNLMQFSERSEIRGGDRVKYPVSCPEANLFLQDVRYIPHKHRHTWIMFALFTLSLLRVHALQPLCGGDCIQRLLGTSLILYARLSCFPSLASV